MIGLARPIVMLLNIIWRFRIWRIVIITLYAIFGAFAWFVQGAVGSWTSGSQYLLLGVAVSVVFLGPAALFLGVTQPRLSWRWGLWLTWPTVLLSASLLPSPLLWTPAVIALPLVVVPVVCGLAWLAAIGRESVGGLLAKPVSNERLRPDTSLMPMTAEERAAEASWERVGRSQRSISRVKRAKKHRRP